MLLYIGPRRKGGKDRPRKKVGYNLSLAESTAIENSLIFSCFRIMLRVCIDFMLMLKTII